MTRDELDQLGFFQRHLWLIFRINLMRYLDERDGGDRFDSWVNRHPNKGFFRAFDCRGIPWNFQDEGHMHKLAKWLGME